VIDKVVRQELIDDVEIRIRLRLVDEPAHDGLVRF
jgi:hypothetical protein